MKTILKLLAMIILSLTLLLPQYANAQSPDKMSYQAVVRDASNLLVTYTEVGIQISILQGSATGTAFYVETHSPTTNANGLVTFEIGDGTVVSGDFAAIDWTDGPYFIKTETDLDGGNNYTITGTSPLLSVPYALHAKTTDSITGGISETDPVFTASPAGDITDDDIDYWNNKLDVEEDGDITNELQILSISGDTIFLTDGEYAILPPETDPVFDTSVAGGITETDTTNWGNHTDSTAISDLGYIAGGLYSVGDFAHGGVVFWLDETGKHGLVCAIEDQESGGERWYAGTYGNTRAYGDGPFSGELNTRIIIAAHIAIGDDGSTYAARLCAELEVTEDGKSYGNWYLPSKEELNLMYQNKATIDSTAVANGGTVFAGTYFWTSTETNDDHAYVQYFPSGYQTGVKKETAFSVRAIRAF